MNTQIRRVFMTLLMSMICFFAFAQKTIHGTVKDASGEPMIGVTVSVDGKAGAVTDLDGNFTINNVSEKSKLKISYIGYVAQTINVGSKSQFDITMQEDAQTLEDVVVVGYGTMKKSDLTGSISSTDGYRENAGNNNIKLYNFINSSSWCGSTGIILMDFVGVHTSGSYTVYGDLCPQAIIDNNYKYRMKRKGE